MPKTQRILCNYVIRNQDKLKNFVPTNSCDKELMSKLLDEEDYYSVCNRHGIATLNSLERMYAHIEGKGTPIQHQHYKKPVWKRDSTFRIREKPKYNKTNSKQSYFLK